MSSKTLCQTVLLALCLGCVSTLPTGSMMLVESPPPPNISISIASSKQSVDHVHHSPIALTFGNFRDARNHRLQTGATRKEVRQTCGVWKVTGGANIRGMSSTSPLDYEYASRGWTLG